ncbi:MgtC/SapB family protein [Pseudohoeflea coraliihabitans]|uniref:Protein MgtC n=1 Tax=Pseudohoeflea coraliihabitans TaxID=2860393 RepID=A0ABS6WLK4_9HYPH|nr:MgtC/SapB family protein [Pseudohoeflea sp. DP4N28-3]MBW3096775.1 MgtC/SapB family protein [Pseudohoeflea sp. DP4N28-3]
MLESILNDMTMETNLPIAVIVARFIGAVLLVSGIGFERELKDRAAGLRTHMLVSLSAAIFAVVALEVVNHPEFVGEKVQLDPLRIIESVTAGVAFLSAGFIIFKRGEVRGVTTGAGIWLAGATGLATGFGYWSIALATAVLGIIIVIVLRRVESAVELKD